MIPCNQNVPVQIKNIEAKTGKSLKELADIVKWTGLTDPGKIRLMLQREYRIAYEEAKIIVKAMLESQKAQEAVPPRPKHEILNELGRSGVYVKMKRQPK